MYSYKVGNRNRGSSNVIYGAKVVKGDPRFLLSTFYSFYMEAEIPVEAFCLDKCFCCSVSTEIFRKHKHGSLRLRLQESVAIRLCTGAWGRSTRPAQSEHNY
jgi:hypothetical protein